MTTTADLPRWLRPDDDSLVAWLAHGTRRTSSIWYPVINLFWLVWMAAAPWFFQPPTAYLFVITYASIALFLVLYQRAWFGSRAKLPAYTLGIALLGLAIIFVNSSWSYVIYAGSLIPFFKRGWRAVGRIAALLAAFYVVAMASGFFEPLVTTSCIATTAIIALFNGIYRVNVERDAELKLTQDEVRRLAIAAERERIGRDLHDLLGHTMSLVAIKSELARRLVTRDPSAAERELVDIERVARQALAQVREAVTGIRATALAGEFASARLMLEAADVVCEVEQREGSLRPEVEAAFALGLREAVTNVHRHAQATKVEIVLEAHGQATELTVRDNGRGGVTTRGNGLSGMAERLAVLGGELLLRSEPGHGTSLTMRVPNGATAAT
jgi:two-component system, NarL family, sensor histidine kinase DesK